MPACPPAPPPGQVPVYQEILREKIVYEPVEVVKRVRGARRRSDSAHRRRRTLPPPSRAPLLARKDAGRGAEGPGPDATARPVLQGAGPHGGPAGSRVRAPRRVRVSVCVRARRRLRRRALRARAAVEGRPPRVRARGNRGCGCAVRPPRRACGGGKSWRRQVPVVKETVVEKDVVHEVRVPTPPPQLLRPRPGGAPFGAAKSCRASVPLLPLPSLPWPASFLRKSPPDISAAAARLSVL